MRVSQVLLAAVCFAACGLLVASASAGIIPNVDYSDTFTVGVGARTDGYYSGGATAAHDVEYAVPTLPIPRWADPGMYSFNSPATVAEPINPYPGSAGNAGSETGFIQTGGGNWSIEYGLRTDYYVQGTFNWATGADCTGGVVDTPAISSLEGAGQSISTATGGLSVLFPRDQANDTGYISLYNGETETATSFATGIAVDDLDWHNFGVQFNQDADELSLYIDEALQGTLDLTTFAGGIYETYSNAAVGIGYSLGNPAAATCISWCDNFQVGGEGVVPEPSTLALLLGGSLVLIIRRRTS